MPRTIGLVVILICAAAAIAAAAAQPAGFPECNRQATEPGGIPDFTGCHVRDAAFRIRRAFGDRVRVETLHDENAAGARPGTVTRQDQEGRLIRLYYAPPSGPAAPAVVPPPAVAGAAAVQPPPPPATQRVSFSISDAAPVEEGKPLVFQISREGDDGQAHTIELRYHGDPGLLVEPAPSIRFEPGDPSQKELVVPTAPGTPGDGEHGIQVLLVPGDDQTSIGIRLGSATIMDAPPPAAPPPDQPQPVRYGIVADGPASRGNDLRFTVTRAGPLGPVQVPYRIVQNGSFSAIDEGPDRVEFAEGQASVPLVVPSGRYSICAETVAVTLGDGAATTASASFSEPPPDWCSPPPTPWLEYLPLLVGGLALATAAVLDKILKPFVRVHPSCTIAPGTATFRPLEQPSSRWPEIRADALITPGEFYVTQPLPRSEQGDG